jgi:hypothetical protein
VKRAGASSRGHLGAGTDRGGAVDGAEMDHCDDD